ncbi:MAG: hypothetical protein IPO00_17835 [Betaproteobacteria bacterium]|nr:hypothetical protein [Betaproteobacteria bacterium]
MTANQAIAGTATQISNLSVGAVNQGAAGANGVTAAVGSGSNVARITEVNTPALPAVLPVSLPP